MRTSHLLRALAVTAVLSVGVAPALGQTSIFHDPFLNWDFVNFTGVDTNDFEIVVESPNWIPPQVYTGFFPDFVTRPDLVSGGTVLSWSGNSVVPGEVAHVGAAMMGSGRILDAYWTKDGIKVGQSIAIVYERTELFPLPDSSEVIVMNLQVAPSFEGTAGLRNIRTFSDLPADLLGLDDLTQALDPALNQLPLEDLETVPAEFVLLDLAGGAPVIETIPLQTESVLPGGQAPPDSFFDVFVDVSFNVGPEFESLLTAEIVVFDPNLDTWAPIGRFWNINPQSPEPTSLVLASLGIVAMLSVRTARQRVDV